MRALLVTPLYPPDIAGPAPYVKELAKRLTPMHSMAILTYGHIPESVDGVRIISVEKSSILPVRLWRFFWALKKEAKGFDVIYAQNGPSVELPLLFFLFLQRTPVILRLGDAVPLQYALTKPLLHRLIMGLIKKADHVVTHDELEPSIRTLLIAVPHARSTIMPRPLTRPEVLPFVSINDTTLHSYETSWNDHTKALVTLFSSYERH